MENKKIAFTLISVIVLALAITAMAYFHKNPFHILEFDPKKSEDAFPSALVSCEVFSTIGGKAFVRMKFNIPCIDRDQERHLEKNLPKIQNQVLLALDAEMADHVRNRDMKALKESLLLAVNRVARNPVREIYLDSFIYRPGD